MRLLRSFVCFLLFGAAAVVRAADGDRQVWFGGSLEGALAGGVKVKVEEAAYYGHDEAEVYQHYFQPTLGWSPCSWLQLAAGCRFVFARASSGWSCEDRILADATLKFAPGDWGFKNRFRIAYRSREGKDDLWRFRNKTNLALPWRLTSWGIVPYLAEEVFLEQEREGIYRNRLYVGMTAAEIFALKHLGGELYLLWQSTDAEPGSEDIYVLGTMLRLCF